MSDEKRKRIGVSIYEDEFETVKEKLEITGDVTTKTVRESLGLKSAARQKGTKAQITDKLANMTEEEKKSILDEILEKKYGKEVQEGE